MKELKSVKKKSRQNDENGGENLFNSAKEKNRQENIMGDSRKKKD